MRIPAVRLNAQTHVAKLGRALERAGWRALADARVWPLTISLAALLCRNMIGGQTSMITTVDQLAEQLGRTSSAHTGRCLRQLEALEIVTWRRGHPVDGVMTPALIQLHPAALLALLYPSRVALERIRALAAAQRAQRVDGVTFWPTGRGSNHRAPRRKPPYSLVGASEHSVQPPLPQGEVGPAAAAPAAGLSAAVAAARAQVRQTKYKMTARRADDPSRDHPKRQ